MMHSFLPSAASILAFAALTQAIPRPQAAPQAKGPTSQYPLLSGSSFGIPGTDQTFDYVILGGGSAGLLMANRLAENQALKVAVIEAGGFYEQDNGNHSQIAAFDIGSAGLNISGVINPLIDWKFVTTPQAVCASKSSLIRYDELIPSRAEETLKCIMLEARPWGERVLAIFSASTDQRKDPSSNGRMLSATIATPGTTSYHSIKRR